MNVCTISLNSKSNLKFVKYKLYDGNCSFEINGINLKLCNLCGTKQTHSSTKNQTQKMKCTYIFIVKNGEMPYRKPSTDVTGEPSFEPCTHDTVVIPFAVHVNCDPFSLLNITSDIGS